MNRTLLQFVLRHTDPDESDPDLLRRFVASRDDDAFATLVKRHGPMVWAACRHLVPSRTDAEDAFQAVFLALAKSAKSVRKPEQLASWLHGVAVRIAGKAKRGFTRRKAHEQRTAKPEADAPVSAGSWNDMLAEVHAEVAKLPQSLRAAFVLCDLEGVEPTDAATRLGVKVNTLSGQLARARQRLLDTLTKRGIGAATVTIGTAGAVPQALADKAAGVITVIPSASVLELATEITAMKLTKLKLLAAGLMLTCGLTLSGLGVLPKAEGQATGGLPGGSGSTGGPGGRPGGLPGMPPPGGVQGLGGASGSPEGGGEGGMPGGRSGMPGEGGMGGMMGAAPTKPSAAFEYDLAKKPVFIDEVAQLLRQKAEKGWEYVGPLDVEPRLRPGESVAAPSSYVVLVFKRAATKPAPGMGSGGGMMGGPGMGGPGMGGMPGGGPGMSGPGIGGPGMGGMGGMGGPVPGKPAELYEVIRLKNVNAEDTAKVINEIFNGPGAKTERVKVVAEKVSNSVIVSKASAIDLETIKKLLEKAMDVKSDGDPKPEARSTLVYPLKYADAAEMAKTIKAVLKNYGSDAVTIDSRSNAVVVNGTESVLEDIKKLIAELDIKPVEKKPMPGEGGSGGLGGGSDGGPAKTNDTLVYKLRHVAPTAELVGLIRTHYADARGQKTSAGLAVAGDAKNNSLVVSGSPSTIELARQIIDTLDVKPAEKGNKVYSAMFKITEVAPSEAVKAWKDVLEREKDAATKAKRHSVEMVGADTFATLIVNAPSESALKDARQWVKENYPKATEVKADAGGR